MQKPTSPWRPNKSFAAVGLTLLASLTCWSNVADAAPSPANAAEIAKKRAEFERYKQYVQTQFSIQEKQMHARKVQQAKPFPANPDEPKSDKPKTAVKRTPVAREDLVLVMVNDGAQADDIKESIASADGEICTALGGGGLGVIVIKAKPGKAAAVQKALAADTKNFKFVQCNRKHKADSIPISEPTYPQAWHLSRMHVPEAWDELGKFARFPMPVAVFDSGVQGPEPFVIGPGANCTTSLGNDKINDLGFQFHGVLGTGLFKDSIKDQEDDIVKIGNLLKTLTYGMVDNFGHGTWVGCTISGEAYNQRGSAGVNPMVPVYPIIVSSGKPGTDPTTDDFALVKAMCVMYDCLNTHIINCSYGDLMSAKDNPILHEFFKDWYYRKNGLVFVSAGNDGQNLSCANQPYVLCVSAMDQKDGMVLVNHKTYKSASGTAVDFTAPGVNIQVCNPDGTPASVDGTSFSSPIVAAVASMIWHVNPNLKNTDVENILRKSCENIGDGSWNPQFGWGMPDALKAVKAAEGTLPSK